MLGNYLSRFDLPDFKNLWKRLWNGKPTDFAVAFSSSENLWRYRLFLSNALNSNPLCN